DRLDEELQEVFDDPPAGCCCSSAELEGGSHLLQVTVAGPVGTPYEGGMFNLMLCIKKDYPFSARMVSFITKIFHCNVSLDGAVSLQAALGSSWSPASSLREVISSLPRLLAEPLAMTAVVPEIAALYRLHRAEHDHLARECTQRFAVI
ncbi:unnamed protein product, partial [Polarella glacialis]